MRAWATCELLPIVIVWVPGDALVLVLTERKSEAA